MKHRYFPKLEVELLFSLDTLMYNKNLTRDKFNCHTKTQIQNWMLYLENEWYAKDWIWTGFQISKFLMKVPAIEKGCIFNYKGL